MRTEGPVPILVAAVFSLTTASAAPVRAQEGSTATGLSRAFNPAIGANGLFLATYTDLDAEEEDGDEHDHGSVFETGLHIQEVEIGLGAVVDPYMRAKITLALHGVEGIELEEAFAQTTGLPQGFGILAGKTYLPFGKHNRLHTHSFPFIDGPWIHTVLLGDHGLNDAGVQLSYLMPLPWFSEATTAVVYPGEESPFIAEEPEDLVYLVNWRNLWDLNAATTFELGASWSGATVTREAVEGLSSPFGHHHEDDEATEHENGCAAGLHFVAAAATVKHVSTRYHSWDVSVEYLQGLGEIDNKIELQYGGITGYGRFQVSRRWWVQGRGDLLGIPMKTANDADYCDPEGDKEEERCLEEGDHPWRVSGMVAFVLSEFTAIRLQIDHTDRIVEEPENRVMLQLNITFGAHPAHSY